MYLHSTIVSNVHLLQTIICISHWRNVFPFRLTKYLQYMHVGPNLDGGNIGVIIQRNGIDEMAQNHWTAVYCTCVYRTTISHTQFKIIQTYCLEVFQCDFPLHLFRKSDGQVAQNVTESLLELRQMLHSQVKQSEYTVHELGKVSARCAVLRVQCM